LIERTRHEWPDPFAPPPPRQARASPLLRVSPPAHPPRYSIPPGSAVRDAPSRHPGLGGSIGPRFLPFHANAAWPGSRCLYAGHRLANKRAPARLIPEFWSHPGFDAVW